MRILVVEDERELAEMIKVSLERAGYAVDLAHTLADAAASVRVATYDAVLLDRHLPDGEGLSLLKLLRERGEAPPVLAITARDALEDRVQGLDRGVDDYLVKPFAFEELHARLRAVLRRPGGLGRGMIEFGDLAFDTTAPQLSVEGQPVMLSRRELSVLEVLLRAPERVVTRERLLEALYGFDSEPDSNVIEVHVSRLRRRLREAGSATNIRVVRGVGYLLQMGEPAS